MNRSTGFQENSRWLTYFAPFRALSISAAYLTPFFLEKGLSLSAILLLQSVFSAAYVALEIPSGYFADRFGRAFSIKLSVPIAAIAMMAYGFSSHFWQFVIWELLLAIANSLISGADTALLIDSLKAEGKEEDYVKVAQRIDGLGFAATATGVPLAIALVHFFGLGSTLVAEGLLTGIGMLPAFRLVEAPHTFSEGAEEQRSLKQAIRELGRSAEVRWLIVLASVLSTSTYLAYWLSAPYYTSLGLPLVSFGAILAIRSAWKAWLSHRFVQKRHLQRNMAAYAALAGLVYLAMASRQIWLIWAVLGHDVVQALHKQPIAARLNDHMDHRHRASVNSVVNLIQRLVFTITGPMAGLLADKLGLSVGFAVLGMVCSTVAFTALVRLKQLNTFHESR